MFDAHRPTFTRAAEVVRAGDEGAQWVPLAVTVGILAVLSAGATSVRMAVVVLGVLLIDDVCRWIGMHLLDHPDRRLLLLPLLRRRLPPRGARAESWKLGLLLLLGPVPGLALAFIAGVVSQASSMPLLQEIAFVATCANALVMLPLMPFDGGKILNVVIFARWRVLELVFLLGTSAVVVYLGVVLDAWVLALFAGLSLLSARRRWSVAKAGNEIRVRWPELDSRPAELGEEPMMALFDEAHRALPEAIRAKTDQGDPRFFKAYAQMMREVHESAVTIAPSGKASLMLGGLYVAGLLLAGATLLVTGIGLSPP